MSVDPRERKRQYRRAAFEARVRGLLLRLIWIFRIVVVVLGIGMLLQTWKLVTGHLPPEEASVLRYQTRNGFIADGVFIGLLLFLERARASFERMTAERAAVAPLPGEAWAPLRAANRVWILFYLWLFRLAWPLFFALVIADFLGLFSPPMNAADRAIFVAIGAVFLLLWAFVARTRGPLTFNRGGRIERRGWNS